MSPPPPGDYCATPQFADSVGPGESYSCHGKVSGVFRYHVCKILDCDDEAIEDIDGDAQDSDFDIDFPGDPTETADDIVEACCDPDVESALEGGDELKEACASDCGHTACNRAIEQFKALVADPPDDDCGALESCQNNVLESLQFFLGYLQDHFNTCVAMVGDGDPGTKFLMGTPGCSGDVGCLVLGELDANCTIDSVDLESNTESCEEARSQPPPPPTRQTCTVPGGEVEIFDGTGSIAPEVLTGQVTTAFFDCAEDACSYVFEGLSLTVDDFDDGGYDVTDLAVELYTAAIGTSDGVDVAFPPGAIRVVVSGVSHGALGATPFTGVSSSVDWTYGTHDDDVLTLDDVVFEVDTYTFTATIDASDCEDI